MNPSNQPPKPETIKTLAVRLANKRPGDGDRIARAMPLVNGVTPGEEGVYMVVSSKGDQTYTVKVNRASKASSCTCKDHENGFRCKHVWAASIWERGREIDYLDF